MNEVLDVMHAVVWGLLRSYAQVHASARNDVLSLIKALAQQRTLIVVGYVDFVNASDAVEEEIDFF
jgi:hypothetical protein